MDASQLPKGQSAEGTPGKPRNLPGIYRHEGAGKELITVADENDGSIQADALVRVGYKRVGDVPSRVELLKMREAQLKKDLEDEKNGIMPEEATSIARTSDPTTAELKAAKEMAEAELAETKKTLEALKAGKQTA